MASKKYDGVVEVVRYKDDGEIDFVRLYQRRGKIFSDRILVSREDLIKRLKAKKVYLTGSPEPYLGATFHVGEPLKLKSTDHGQVIVAGSSQSSQDELKGVPRI